MKRFITAAICLFVALPAYAFNFTLSEAEFHTWDERCKKAFAGSGAGRSSGFYRYMSDQQRADAGRFGEEAGGAWHYCAGVIYLQRGAATVGQEREGNLKRAVAEMGFTVRKIKPAHSWYPDIHVNYARALYTNDQNDEAFAVLNRLITSHPTNSLAYTALAYYLKRENQLEKAIETLQRAPELLLNESAELNYFLGWYQMEADNIDAAVEYAKRAYALNYPVPTLRQRLAAKGYDW